MKVTYNWIKEFVDVKIAPEALAEKMTMAGLSVATLERFGDDWVYDIEVTSNRPDWLSVRGIVREVAAITGLKIKKTDDRRWTIDDGKGKTKKPRGPRARSQELFSLSVEDQKDCELYCGTLITGVKVGPSPQGLRTRLESLGLRPVNNVVDITNYCLWEYGQPLHAFDFDKLTGSAIVVRRAKAAEKLTLIDGSSKDLTSDVLVIADASRPVACAGIMGGRDTEVTKATKNVLLEAAVFDPVLVRRGARALGIASDASYRFERGVDPATTKVASDRACAMIARTAGGRLEAVKVAGRSRLPQDRKIVFNLAEARDVLSLAISSKKAAGILKNLGFGVRVKKADIFEVVVPVGRRDIAIKEDIVEELARSYGYDHIPLTAPQIKPFLFEAPAIRRVGAVVKELMAASGCHETVTYSLINEEDYKKSLVPGVDAALSLANPLSEEAHLLRTTLIPSLLKCAAFNCNQGNRDFGIFEIARIFQAGEEKVALGIVLVGNRRETWEREARPYTLFDLKGLIETVTESLQVKELDFSSKEEAFAAPSTGCVVSVAGARCGVMGQLSEAVKKNWSIKVKADFFVAEICLDALAAHARFARVFRPITATPCVRRDISLVASKGSSFKRIQEVVFASAGSQLKSVTLAGSYQGVEIPRGAMGLTISLEYGVGGKTLTDEEVNAVHERVLEALVGKLGIVLR